MIRSETIPQTLTFHEPSFFHSFQVGDYNSPPLRTNVFNQVRSDGFPCLQCKALHLIVLPRTIPYRTVAYLDRKSRDQNHVALLMYVLELELELEMYLSFYISFSVSFIGSFPLRKKKKEKKKEVYID